MSFVQCGSAVHHYRVRGDLSKQPLLVFINGLGTDQRIWDPLLDVLPAQLATLVYDLRGQGLSELGAGRHDVAALSDDLELLLQHLGARCVVPVGFSMGGLVAQQFALAHPERVSGLVLCATAARIGSAESWGQRAEAVRRGGLAAVVDAVIERWFSEPFRARSPQLVRGYRTLLERADPAGYLAALGLLAQADLSALMPRLSLPVLAVAGGADLATPPELVRGLAERIAGAEFRLLAGAGHLLGVEQPEALARAINEFLRGAGLV
ncbi:MAG TPA: 3-oxoadipate enol-lactonase [Polyangiaceae bacterium]|nr:3-oxoadipate enol-lactonase [Polyangiaceae bacterium]